ncbi:DUF3072 domain-containing protein [Thalassorhabdomicrobium marinisediminis]|nr:DUF3072 domain-containing protein [Thalassorhabdomicrobium marinisediminis]
MMAPIKVVAGKEERLMGADDGEPMTEEQAVRLRVLCEQQDLEFDGNLTRAEAEARIHALEEAQD